MSGGKYEYIQDRMCEEIYGYPCELPRYRNGEKYEPYYKESFTLAISQNPFHDIELSGLMFDMLYMVHILDFLESGDIGDDTYLEEVAWFKNKWLKPGEEERIKELAYILYEDAHEQVRQTIENYEVKANDK